MAALEGMAEGEPAEELCQYGHAGTCMYVCTIHAGTCMYVRTIHAGTCMSHVLYMLVHACTYYTCWYMHVRTIHAGTCMYVLYM